MLPNLITILGPTASGKTDLAIALAKKFNGEIISADSRQFYRGAPIGAAVVPGRFVKRGRRRVYVAEGVPHHLIVFRSPHQPLTVADFQRLAERRIAEIIKRGRLPILCGGSGLYLKSITDNLEIPAVPPNPELRQRLERLSDRQLRAKLTRLDPEYAARVSGDNRRYLTRALEVIAATGRKFSEMQGQGSPKYRVLRLGVTRPRAELYRRINARVDQMMQIGLLAEAKRFGRLYGWDTAAATALGLRQLGGYLNGQMTLEEAVERVKRDTRHYAKRQVTYFKRDKLVKWVKTLEQAERLLNWFLKKK